MEHNLFSGQSSSKQSLIRQGFEARKPHSHHITGERESFCYQPVEGESFCYQPVPGVQIEAGSGEGSEEPECVAYNGRMFVEGK